MVKFAIPVPNLNLPKAIKDSSTEYFFSGASSKEVSSQNFGGSTNGTHLSYCLI